MKKIILILILGIGISLTGIAFSLKKQELNIEKQYVIENTLYLHIQETKNKDIEKIVKRYAKNNIQYNDLVIRIYKDGKLKCQYEYELRNEIKQINYIEINN